MTDIRGSPISDFELEFGLWSCHCCGKVNDIKRSKCIICGREAGYTTSEYKPFHGERMKSMTRAHVLKLCKEDESQREAMDDHLMRPIHNAVMKNNYEVVDALIEVGCRFDVKTKFHYTPLMLAIDCGHFAIVELLVKAGADVNVVTPGENLTPLLIACKHGYGEMARLLIKNGAEINVKDVSGRTPLHYCAINCDTIGGSTLIREGHPIDVEDRDEWTPYQYADYHNAKNFQLLILYSKGQMSEVHNFPQQTYHSVVWDLCKSSMPEKEEFLYQREKFVDDLRDEMKETMGFDIRGRW